MGVWDLRALTSGEIDTLEEEGQASRYGLAILPVRVVFSALVSAVPSSDDRVAQISYGSGVGNYTDILPDMTVFVGTEAGAYDKGTCRARKAATSSVIYLGELSDIDWEVGDHLTVIEDFDIWARHLRIVGSDDDFVVYMDWDVAYSDQHANCDPVPVLGSHIIKKLVGASIQVTEFDASDSWVRGSTVTDYAWVAPGASGTAGMATANPTITYDAAGWYRVSCTLTAANGKSFQGHRWVYVYDDDHPPVWVEQSCEGNYRDGGWIMRVTGKYDVALGDLRNRALVLLFAEDSYGGEGGSVGIVAGRENVMAFGWVMGESIRLDAVHGSVEFEAQGPQWWIDKVTGFPVGIEDVGTAAATNWMEWSGLTVDDALFQFLHWRSTVTRMMDVFLPGSSMPIGMFSSGMATLWAQMLEACERTVKARPCCDKFARLVIETDSQLIPVADRASIPVIMDIEKSHWREAIQIRRVVVDEVGRVDLSGVKWTSATLSGSAICSLSPGHVPKRHGGVEPVDHLALSSQAQSNLLAGLILGNRNNPYPSIMVPFGMNVRAWDICPRQYGRITVEAGDTPRGIALTDFLIVPRRVVFSPQIQETGTFGLVDVDFEGYTTQATFCDGDIPATPPGPGPPPSPPPPPPPPGPPPLGDPGTVIFHDRSHVLMTEEFGADPTWEDIKGSLNGVVWSVHADVFNGCGCWAVTGTDNVDANDTGADVGIWYCQDVFSGAPWQLVASQYDCSLWAYDALVLESSTLLQKYWGQIRSLKPIGAGEAVVGEAKWHGYWDRTASYLLHVTPGGIDDYHSFPSYPDGKFPDGINQEAKKCPSTQVCCRADVKYVNYAYWCHQYNLRGCHQVDFIEGILRFAGLVHIIDPAEFCPKGYPPCPCPGEDDYLDRSSFPIEAATWGYKEAYGGKHLVDGYMTVEGGPSGADGVLISSSGMVVDTDIFDGYSFVPIALTSRGLYWCKWSQRLQYANEVIKDGSPLGIYSEELFGTAGDAGRIGYVGPWDGELGDGLIIVRKDKPHPSQTTWPVIYWWDGADCLDKTGNIPSVITRWAGTGIRANPGETWHYQFDNVGVTVFETELP